MSDRKPAWGTTRESVTDITDNKVTVTATRWDLRAEVRDVTITVALDTTGWPQLWIVIEQSGGRMLRFKMDDRDTDFTALAGLFGRAAAEVARSAPAAPDSASADPLVFGPVS